MNIVGRKGEPNELWMFRDYILDIRYPHLGCVWIKEGKQLTPAYNEYTPRFGLFANTLDFIPYMFKIAERN